MNNPFAYVPGISVAQGMNAGYQAAGAGLQNANTINQLSEFRKNAALRDVQRATALDQAQTLGVLGQQANSALRDIQAYRKDLYNSPDGYMNAMNAIAPLGDGQTRRLSSDNRTIETIDPAGQVIGTVPNLRGQAAENALINSGGINLYERAANLPKQEMHEADLQTKLAIAQMETDMKLQLMAAGLRGGRGGAGGAAGAGQQKFNPSDLLRAMPDLIRSRDFENKLAYDDKGNITFGAQTTPAQRDLYAKLENEVTNTALAGRASNLSAADIILGVMSQGHRDRADYLQRTGNVNRLAGIAQQNSRDLDAAVLQGTPLRQPQAVDPYDPNTPWWNRSTPLAKDFAPRLGSAARQAWDARNNPRDTSEYTQGY